MVNDFFLTNWIFEGMRWVYQNVAVGDVVLTIVICTLILKLITLAADIKSRKSTIQMQAIQPELDKIRKKYEHDPQKMQMEQSKYMKSKGVSMWGGCLPMLLMMPLFFMFIAAFRFWGYEQMVRVLLELNETGGTSPLFDSFQFLWINNIWQPDNGTVPVIMEAKQFLSTANLNDLLYFQENPAAWETFSSLFPIIGNTPTDAAILKYNELIAPIMAQYEGISNGWFIIPILAAGAIFLSSWVTQKGQNKTAPAAEETQKTNKIMMFAMPVVSFIACLSSTAAFGVYWIVSSVISMITTVVINKLLVKDSNVVEVKQK